MDYKRAIIELINKADERTLKLIYRFIKGLLD